MQAYFREAWHIRYNGFQHGAKRLLRQRLRANGARIYHAQAYVQGFLRLVFVSAFKLDWKKIRFTSKQHRHEERKQNNRRLQTNIRKRKLAAVRFGISIGVLLEPEPFYSFV